MSGCYATRVSAVEQKPLRADAARNREALISAARTLFAQHGTEVPLQAIAKAAGVGQASLYRHFPDRESLIIAIFEENFTTMEATSARYADSPDQFARVWTELIDFSIDSKGFAGIVALNDHPDERVVEMVERLEALLSGPLQRAIAGGVVEAHWTVADLVLVVQMLSGALAGVPLEQTRDVADAVLRLVGLDHIK